MSECKHGAGAWALCVRCKEDHIQDLEQQLTELRETQKRVKKFPVMLRKMWSGREVKAWIEAALKEQGDG